MSNNIPLYNSVLPNITSMGLFTVEKPWMHMDRTIDVDALLFVLEGAIHVCEEETEYIIEKGEVFFFKNNVRHYGTSMTPPGSRWFWVCFLPPTNTNNESAYWLPKKFEPINPLHFEQELATMLELYRSNEAFKYQQINGKIYQLLFNLQKQTLTSDSTTYNQTLSQSIIELLSQNACSRFQSSFISAPLNMSYNYLCRVFKKETGRTISQYHTELRIQKAKELLITSEMNISEISDALDFPNPYHFSRTFKSIVGHPPTVYLKQLYN